MGPQAGCPWFSRGEWQLRLTRSSLTDSFTLVHLPVSMDTAGRLCIGICHKTGQTGGCSRSTELAIVALKQSWRQSVCWKTVRRAENSKWPAFEVTTAAHDSRAVGTARHQSHRTIDPQCLKKSPPRRGGIYALTENVSSSFHAEPRHFRFGEYVGCFFKCHF